MITRFCMIFQRSPRKPYVGHQRHHKLYEELYQSCLNRVRAYNSEVTIETEKCGFGSKQETTAEGVYSHTRMQNGICTGMINYFTQISYLNYKSWVKETMTSAQQYLTPSCTTLFLFFPEGYTVSFTCIEWKCTSSDQDQQMKRRMKPNVDFPYNPPCFSFPHATAKYTHKIQWKKF